MMPTIIQAIAVMAMFRRRTPRTWRTKKAWAQTWRMMRLTVMQGKAKHAKAASSAAKAKLTKAKGATEASLADELNVVSEELAELKASTDAQIEQLTTEKMALEAQVVPAVVFVSVL